MSLPTKFSICLIEKDEWYARVLRYHLELNPDYNVTVFKSHFDFRKSKLKNWGLIAVSIPEFNKEIEASLLKIKRNYSSTPILGFNLDHQEHLIEKLKNLGITYFLHKGETTKEKLWQAVIDIKKNKTIKKEKKKDAHKNNQVKIIGNSFHIKKVFDLIRRGANSTINIFVTGETGTGKELVAKKVHYSSARANEKLVSLNMAAIPYNLIESELFGHEKGAFTGASKRKIGKLELANKGTIFLDEIAEIPLEVQKKLLRVLEEKKITRIGGNESIDLDIRLISASHKNLMDEVEKGNFREDLFYRLMGLKIVLPPLRNRKEDIPLLVNHFLNNTSEEVTSQKFSISEKALVKLSNHYFRGNIRELKSIIELSKVLSDSDLITDENIMFNDEVKPVKEEYETNMTLKEHTIKIISAYLLKHRNNVLLASRALGIGKSTIYNMISKGDIEL